MMFRCKELDQKFLLTYQKIDQSQFIKFFNKNKQYFITYDSFLN